MGVGVSETTGYDDMYVYEVPYSQRKSEVCER